MDLAPAEPRPDSAATCALLDGAGGDLRVAIGALEQVNVDQGRAVRRLEAGKAATTDAVLDGPRPPGNVPIDANERQGCWDMGDCARRPPDVPTNPAHSGSVPIFCQIPSARRPAAA
jgi:hypothetical protein